MSRTLFIVPPSNNGTKNVAQYLYSNVFSDNEKRYLLVYFPEVVHPITKNTLDTYEISSILKVNLQNLVSNITYLAKEKGLESRILIAKDKETFLNLLTKLPSTHGLTYLPSAIRYVLISWERARINTIKDRKERMRICRDLEFAINRVIQNISELQYYLSEENYLYILWMGYTSQTSSGRRRKGVYMRDWIQRYGKVIQIRESRGI